MPAPAIYVAAAIGAIAAGIAFKQFVYEPHLAPKLEQWAEEFLAKRRARRQVREGYGLISVPAHSDDDDDNPSIPQGRTKTNSLSDDSNNFGQGSAYPTTLDSIELETLRQWRAEVDGLQNRRLRHRNNAGRSSSNQSPGDTITHIPMSPPTHILFDPSVPSTPSTATSHKASPAVRSTTLETIEEPFRPESSSPRRPLVESGKLPTPDPSVAASPSPRRSTLSPARVPSLSEAYPVELDSERGIELLSAPSSRAETPFSSFSNPTGRGADTQVPSNIFEFSSPNTRSPDLEEFASPALSHPLSELDFLSDVDEHNNMMSPQSVITDATWDDEDDASSSGGSDSSWASAGPRGQ